MHDHNLDDLIIDNIEPKNSKLKSFLTIIALLIVILIVAIVLTRILLKTPENNDLVFEQESAELIAPELKLKETPKQSEAKKEQVRSTIVDSTPKPAVVEQKKPEVVKEAAIVTKKEEPAPAVTPPLMPKVTETKKEPALSNITEQEIKAPISAEQKAKDAADIAYWESVQAKRKAEQEAREKTVETPKPVEVKKAEVPVVAKPKPVVKVERTPTVKKPVQKSAPKRVYANQYYVQVGAFRTSPSSRFLSVIRNNGYSYTMTKPNASGIKRLLIGPFNDKESVDRALIRIKDRIHKRAFVVKR